MNYVFNQRMRSRGIDRNSFILLMKCQSNSTSHIISSSSSTRTTTTATITRTKTKTSVRKTNRQQPLFSSFTSFINLFSSSSSSLDFSSYSFICFFLLIFSFSTPLPLLFFVVFFFDIFLFVTSFISPSLSYCPSTPFSSFFFVFMFFHIFLLLFSFFKFCLFLSFMQINKDRNQ